MMDGEIERLGRELFEQSIILEAHRQTHKRLKDALEEIVKITDCHPSKWPHHNRYLCIARIALKPHRGLK